MLDRERKLLARVTCTRNRLYMLNLIPATSVSVLTQHDNIVWLCHARFHHLHFRALQNLSNKEMVRGIPHIDHEDEFCDGCVLGKHRKPFPQATTYRARRPLELVHIDLCGLIEPATFGGKRYFLLIVDDFSRFIWVKLLRSNHEAFQHF